MRYEQQLQMLFLSSRPPPLVFTPSLIRHCGLRLFGIVEARFMKRIYTISICDTRTSRLASIYTLCRYSRNATPPTPLLLPPLPLSLAYQNAYCTLDKILARHFSFNMQLGNSASKLKLDAGRMVAEGRLQLPLCWL